MRWFLRSVLRIIKPSGHAACDETLLFNQVSDTMQMSILLLEKPVLNPLVGLTSERAFKAVQLGVILGSVVSGLVVFKIIRLCKFRELCLALLTLNGVVLLHDV